MASRRATLRRDTSLASPESARHRLASTAPTAATWWWRSSADSADKRALAIIQEAYEPDYKVVGGVVLNASSTVLLGDKLGFGRVHLSETFCN